MKIEYLKVSELKPYARNAKVHTEEQIAQIAKSISDFGWQQPIVVDKNNVVVIGHGRLLAAKQLGLETAPCVKVTNLSDDEIRALRIVDNKTNESEWDLQMLELDKLDLNFDLSAFGFETASEVVEKEQERKKTVAAMELKTFEHYDYVVFVFRNQMDWLNVVNEFGIKKVDAGYGKTKKIGVGRVIDGKRLIEKIRS